MEGQVREVKGEEEDSRRRKYDEAYPIKKMGEEMHNNANKKKT